ncbi:ArnT family glycosyltransferase [Uliginosibacterium sp. H1]|uniref:ArnT family glycosyltransferase n=1 Tax=Uliginosibacterium sp. H1 TaxID=3114757 RepID=UPI002E18AF85|nr:hypothetical protein [Uliginosibacterium sp. H1]
MPAVASPISLPRPLLSRSTLWTALALLAAVAVLVLLRLHTADESLERDIVIHAIIGNEFLHGRSLYSDLWNHKPPASFLIHAAFNQVFGFGPQYILAMNLVFNTATLLAIFGLGLALTRNRFAAVCAAVLWALLSFDMDMQANQPNSEALVNPMFAGGILLWYAVSERWVSDRWAFLAGFLFFVTTYFKQHFVFVPIAIALAFLTHAALFARPDFVRQLRIAVWTGAVGCVGWLLVFAVFWLQGSLKPFFEAAFLYNEGYGGNWLYNIKRAYWMGIFPAWSAGALYPYLPVTAVGVLGALLSRHWKPLLVMLAWLGSTFLIVVVPGRFFAHYYQLWIPPLLVGTAFCVHYLLRLPRPVGVALAASVLLAALGYTGVRLKDHVSYQAWQWSAKKYPGDRFNESRAIGEALARGLPRAEPVFFFGRDPGLFLYGGLRAVNGKIYVRWFNDNKYSPALLAHAIAQFKEARFDVVVVNSKPTEFGAEEIGEALLRDFVMVPECFAHNEVWVRRGSPHLATLERTLLPASQELLPRYGVKPESCEQTTSKLLLAPAKTGHGES